jgi:hypothetical protein
MKVHQRRIVSFAGTAVAIGHAGSRAARLVEFLYSHTLGAASDPYSVSYDLVSHEDDPIEDDPIFSLYRDGVEIYRGDCQATVAELLLGDTCHHLAKHSRGGLLFHAAALAWRGQGLLMPGAIGAGKTTLAAYLAAGGLDYLTDEIVFIPHGETIVEAFTRPLNVKAPARPVLQHYVDFQASAEPILCNAQACLISPRLFGLPGVPEETSLKLVVFPTYHPEARPALHPLSKAQAGMALMQCLVNARNLSQHGFSEITRLARSIPAYEMPFNSLDQVKDRILALLYLDTFSKADQT